MFDHLDRNEHMILRDTRLEEAVRSAITQMDKMADDYLRDYLTARGITLATPEHDAAVAAKALRDVAESDAITIPDALGYKVQAVAVEDLLDHADAIEREAGESNADT